MQKKTRAYPKKIWTKHPRRRRIIRKHPRWYYSTTWGYMTARYTKLNHARQYYKEIYRQEPNRFTAAKHLGTGIHKDFRSNTVQQPPSFVAVLKKGRIWGKKAYVLSNNYRLLHDISFDFNANQLRSMKNKKVYKKWKKQQFKYIPETVALLAFCAPNNYFHWMFDILPRVALLRESGYKIDRFLINRQYIFPFQEETLTLLGISKEKRIETHYRQVALQFKKLVVPSLVNQYNLKPHTYVKPYIIPKWACDFLRKEFLYISKMEEPKQSERIYISRENAWNRKVVNEEEVIRYLAGYGFEKVTLESMTVAQQIQLFSSAKVIVAPHGAGLTNLVFCSPGTKVIELFSPIYMPAYYWMISNHVHLDYYYVVCENRAASLVSQDFFVPPDKLLEFVKLAGV